MEAVESKSQSEGQDSQTISVNSVRLKETLEGFHKCVKEIFTLIEKDEDLSEVTAESYDIKMFELKKLVTELSHIHGELADIHLTGEVIKNTEKITTPIKTQHAECSTSTSTQVTQTLNPNTDKFKTPVGFDVTFSTSGGGFHISRRECPSVKETKVGDPDPDVLLKKISALEEDVLRLQKKLENLSEENSNLKRSLHGKKSDLQCKKKHLKDEKAKVVELEKQVSELKLEISESTRKLETTEKVLEASRKQVSNADEENARLAWKLVEQTRCMREFESTGENLASLYSHSQEQKAAYDKLKEKVTLEVSVRDDEIKKLKANNNRLKTDLIEKSRLVEAHVDKVRAEMSSRDDKIRELETRLGSVQADRERVVLSFDGEKNDLKVKVVELEKEVERQREMMSERAEEKREAIRQLSSILEHYRSTAS